MKQPPYSSIRVICAKCSAFLSDLSSHTNFHFSSISKNEEHFSSIMAGLSSRRSDWLSRTLSIQRLPATPACRYFPREKTEFSLPHKDQRLTKINTFLRALFSTFTLGKESCLFNFSLINRSSVSPRAYLCKAAINSQDRRRDSGRMGSSFGAISPHLFRERSHPPFSLASSDETKRELVSSPVGIGASSPK